MPLPQMLRSWIWQVQWRSTRPPRINTKKRCPFHQQGLECKNRKSRDTWNNRQVSPWSTKWSRAKADSFAKRTHWSQQRPSSSNTRDNCTPKGMSPNGQYRNQIDYICSWRWKNSKQLAKTRLGSDCGSDHQLLTEKLRIKSKKVGKTTRPFR